jgi:hypothetical protein
MIDLSVSGIRFHKNVPVKMEEKRCFWQTTKENYQEQVKKKNAKKIKDMKSIDRRGN